MRYLISRILNFVYQQRDRLSVEPRSIVGQPCAPSRFFMCRLIADGINVFPTSDEAGELACHQDDSTQEKVFKKGLHAER